MMREGRLRPGRRLQQDVVLMAGLVVTEVKEHLHLRREDQTSLVEGHTQTYLVVKETFI